MRDPRAVDEGVAAGPGPAVPVAGRRRSGPFLLADAGGRFVLEWFATLPGWALPPVDGAVGEVTFEA